MNQFEITIFMFYTDAKFYLGFIETLLFFGIRLPSYLTKIVTITDFQSWPYLHSHAMRCTPFCILWETHSFIFCERVRQNVSIKS